MKYLLLFILFSISHTTNRNILEDYHTILKGLNVSSDYDVVVKSEKKHYENITFERKKPVVQPLYIIDDNISNISQAVCPFNFIEISIQLTQNINHNTFYRFYESQIGIQKWFLKRKINTNLFFRNVFNQKNVIILLEQVLI